MSRLAFTLTLLACAVDVGPVESRTAELRTWERLEQQQVRIEALERSQVELAQQVDDARKLALVGGPVPRYRVGVKCKDGPFMPGSVGECAHRALWATGWCEDSVLPTPEQHRAVLVSR